MLVDNKNSVKKSATAVIDAAAKNKNNSSVAPAALYGHKIKSLKYPRSLWQESVVPIISPEPESDTKTIRYAVYQHSPDKPNCFIIEEKDWKYYYSGNEYFRDGGLYFYEASIPDLSVKKGYIITSHKQGLEGQEINLGDSKLLRKVEVKCNCNCTAPKCEHKQAVITFLKIKREFKRCSNNNNNISNADAAEDLERSIPG